jgi:hypothetical protein
MQRGMKTKNTSHNTVAKEGCRKNQSTNNAGNNPLIGFCAQFRLFNIDKQEECQQELTLIEK